ncbi:hypothetical protein L7F22_043890 [Adiantum nelumboides]|nr:hypothetical protein [Adiantum nelumboides]
MTESAQQIAKRVLADLDALVGQGKLQQHQIASIRSELEPVARPAPPPIIARKPVIVARKRFRAIWAYNGTDADEITFNEGDLLELIDEVSEGWWKGCIVYPDGRKGQEGMFPSNYVEVLPDNTIVAPQRTVPPLPQRQQIENGPPGYTNQNTDEEKRAMGYHTQQQPQPYSDSPLGPPRWQPGVARWSSGAPMPPPPPPSNFSPSPGPMSPPPSQNMGYYNQPPMPYGGATPDAFGNQSHQQLQQPGAPPPPPDQPQKHDKVSILYLMKDEKDYMIQKLRRTQFLLLPLKVQKDRWPIRRKNGRRICWRSRIWRWCQFDQSAVNSTEFSQEEDDVY